MEFKYIMLSDGNRDVPIIFPKQICHKDMLKVAVKILPSPSYTFEIVSAGFVNLFPPVTCFGESETLHVKSRPVDSIIIKLYNWQHGVYDSYGAQILLDALNKLENQKC